MDKSSIGEVNFGNKFEVLIMGKGNIKDGIDDVTIICTFLILF